MRRPSQGLEAPWASFFAGLGFPELEGTLAKEIEVSESLPSATFLLEKVPVQVLKSYLRWRLASAANPALTKDFSRATNNFLVNMNGRGKTMNISVPPSVKAVKKKCASQTESHLPFLLGKFYSDEKFPPKSQAMALQLIDQLQKAFGDAIDNVRWQLR